MRLTGAVPIVPARKVEATTAWYRDRLGFEVHHVDDGYGIIGRDAVYVHFWGPSETAPENSTYMYRVAVSGIDELYAEAQREGIVHPNGPLGEQPWGSREFAVLDCDGNQLTFYEFADA